MPTQARSRHRVERVLDAAATLVVRDGVEALSTREIARAAGMPVASLYQYFADKDDVLLALAQRDMDEMDAEVAAALADVAPPSSTVAALVRDHDDGLRAGLPPPPRLRGDLPARPHQRRGPPVRPRAQRADRDHAARLRPGAGLAGAGSPPSGRVLAVEVGDRIFQLAFEHDDEGDPLLVEEGIALVTAYLERYAS